MLHERWVICLTSQGASVSQEEALVHVTITNLGNLIVFALKVGRCL
jgi:hypothetical protein